MGGGLEWNELLAPPGKALAIVRAWLVLFDRPVDSPVAIVRAWGGVVVVLVPVVLGVLFFFIFFFPLLFLSSTPLARIVHYD